MSTSQALNGTLELLWGLSPYDLGCYFSFQCIVDPVKEKLVNSRPFFKCRIGFNFYRFSNVLLWTRLGPRDVAFKTMAFDNRQDAGLPQKKVVSVQLDRTQLSECWAEGFALERALVFAGMIVVRVKGSRGTHSGDEEEDRNRALIPR